MIRKQSRVDSLKNADQTEKKEVELTSKAIEHLKFARGSIAGARSAIRGSKGYREYARFRGGFDPIAGSSAAVVGIKSGRKQLQQAGPKPKTTNPSRRPVASKKKAFSVKSVSGDYTPAGVSNRFSLNTPMPMMDVSETAINHARYGTGACVVGSEFLFSLGIQSGTMRGSLIEMLPFNPRFWGGTRLQIMSQLWNRYLVKNMVLEYVPVTNATQSGAIQMWPDYDPDSFPPFIVGDAAIRRGLAYQNSVQGQVFSYIRSCFNNSDMSEAYFLDPEEGDVRLISQGTWYVQAASDLEGPVDPETSRVFGNIIVHYEIDFFLRALIHPGPEITNGQLTASFMPVRAQMSYASTPDDNDCFFVPGQPLALWNNFSLAPVNTINWWPFSINLLADPGDLLFLTINSTDDAEAHNEPTIVGYGETIISGASWQQQPSFYGKFVNLRLTSSLFDETNNNMISVQTTVSRNILLVFVTLQDALSYPSTIDGIVTGEFTTVGDVNLILPALPETGITYTSAANDVALAPTTDISFSYTLLPRVHSMTA